MTADQYAKELAAIRARVAEVEVQAERYRLATLRQDADLARVTAERDNARAQALADRAFQSDNAALRARNAELESSCRDLRVAYEQNASQCVRLNRELALKSDTVEWLNGVTIQRQRAEQAEQRNAELVAALRPIYALRKNCEGDIGWRGQKDAKVGWVTVRDILALEQALARAESATARNNPMNNTPDVSEPLRSSELVRPPPSVSLPLKLRERGNDAWIEDADGREALGRTQGFESGSKHEQWLRWIVRTANATIHPNAPVRNAGENNLNP